MGERILREEGYEVVSIADGESAIQKLADFDPDVVLADIHMPRKSGYEICRKAKGARDYVRVILTAGLLEPVDEAEVRNSGSDALLKKPFEATAVLETIRPLIAQAQVARGLTADAKAAAATAFSKKTGGKSPDQPSAGPVPVARPGTVNINALKADLAKRGTFAATAAGGISSPVATPSPATPPPIPAFAAAPVAPDKPPIADTPPELDPERIEAAVVLAVERAMPGLIREITEQVIASLNRR